MQQTPQWLTGVALAGLMSAEVFASGVGASLYVPGRAAQPVVQACPTAQGAPAASCGSCQRLGFACVDHATVAPCTAEGGCYPARASYGYYKTKWRRWPGSEEGRPKPQEAGVSEDSLLPPYEEPKPEEEDQQAPPPIEDESDETDSEGGDFENFDRGGREEFRPDRQGVEIELPPLPRGPAATPNPTPQFQPEGTPQFQPPQATPPFQDGPPSLPFGFAPPAPAASPAASDAWSEQAPRHRSMPTSLPKSAIRLNDGPPPLPEGFTLHDSRKTPRRLPVAGGSRFDGAVRQASAQAAVAK